MKTLDEVIKGMEGPGICYCCYPDRRECPYHCRTDLSDALHYLQAFRDAKDTLEREKERYAEAVRNCDKAEVKYTMLCMEYARNDPLNWEDLKQMEGKPVWVEADDGKYTSWFVIGNFFSYFEKEDFDAHINLYTFGRTMEFSKETYGGYWQAYRKERA